jgi:hypothetical protein
MATLTREQAQAHADTELRRMEQDLAAVLPDGYTAFAEAAEPGIAEVRLGFLDWSDRYGASDGNWIGIIWRTELMSNGKVRYSEVSVRRMTITGEWHGGFYTPSIDVSVYGGSSSLSFSTGSVDTETRPIFEAQIELATRAAERLGKESELYS